MIEKYQLDGASGGEQQDFETIVISFDRKRLQPFESMIGSVLVNHFYVKIVFTSIYDPRRDDEFRAMEILGTSRNVCHANYVYWFLRNNIHALWREFQIRSKVKGVAARNSYFKEYYLHLKKNWIPRESREWNRFGSSKKTQGNRCLRKRTKNWRHMWPTVIRVCGL